MESVHKAIKSSLSEVFPGKLVFPTDFRGTGSQEAIKMALSRLVRTGELKRIAHGIYYKPQIDPVLGELLPSVEAVAQQLAEKEKVRIRPSGAFALNKLGLSEQIPTKLVYLTDGNPRKLKIGKVSLEFKATTPKKMSLKGNMSGLLILALDDLNLDYIAADKEKNIYKLLQKGDPYLQHDLQLAPGKIYNYLTKLLQKLNDGTTQA
jgi:hypothetical protein